MVGMGFAFGVSECSTLVAHCTSSMAVYSLAGHNRVSGLIRRA